ncbi:MAG TPA: response regulator [Xanthobacteraceae bacterium]|nr:response regulator [Xanthobacteraceae bacterium]
MSETTASSESRIPGEIFVVDDDAAIRDLLTMLFTRQGFKVAGFADGASLMAAIRTQSPACILLDAHIPGKSGLDILKELNARSHPAPVIIISGKGDIAMAVDAIKSGALDFIEKPFSGSDVVARVEEAIAADAKRSAAGVSEQKSQFYFPGREPLTAREQDVLGRLVEGATNKEAGQQLGISYRTIEIHRARIMEKLGAKNAADLMRIVLSENRSPGA